MFIKTPLICLWARSKSKPCAQKGYFSVFMAIIRAHYIKGIL
ncbi:hypothetical protein HAL07_03140 [Helicobacter ailurogastricus]|uniref:Uncharacterized protein n=1 Tax=Helicobacter ailurogastricus TaxID=1578720 RepID=A0A0K2X5B9_9HELI|nr:hypothetical protein HAL011_04800 [Helicobacter ailurogastricus]CRF44340.1 hypothetical protein HAL09_09160 [Helicobacter ailurogastricus]CRF52188.1 hypothetical protein HAL07_03140 [Helicobacter ailurogastricus]